MPQIPAGARLTARLRDTAGRRIRDAGSTVIQAARDLHLSRPTVMEAFHTQARDVTEAPLPQVTVLGIDETRRGRPSREQDAETGKWRLTRDRRHTGFVDAPGHGGCSDKSRAVPLSWGCGPRRSARDTERHARRLRP
ncbi:hypothetical protein ACIQGZ_20360 [Streptomyces sp. NPDC092296]|uniref:hypothetical protein n=1 Tax=Streptomyces sp. NPDC092296 TaxID=3366012 RepID=UPI0037F63367